MINPEDEVTVNLRTSCTRDEAVIKMFGWMQGPIHKIDRATNDPLGQMLQLGEFKGSLSEALQKRREAARQALIDAADAGADGLEVLDKEYAVKQIDLLIVDAMNRLYDIDAEIAKGQESALVKDLNATDKYGEDHLTLRSLDAWTRSVYAISILGQDYESPPTNECVEAGAVISDADESDLDGVLSKPIADNLYTTLAYLVENLCATVGPSLRSGDDPNVSQVAARISNLTNDKLGDPLPGQSVESIRKHLAKARIVKAEKLAKHR